MKPFEEIEATVRELFGGVPIAEENCLSIVKFEPDNILLRMEIQSRHINHHGTLHGGYTLMLADCAAGVAALTDGRNYVTQSQNFTFLRGISGHTAHASGTVISRGKTVTVVHVQIMDENGKLSGDGSFNMYAISRPLTPHEIPESH